MKNQIVNSKPNSRRVKPRSRTKSPVLFLFTALLISGCAIHYEVKKPAIPEDDLQAFTIGTTISDPREIRSRALASGGVLAGVASDKADRDAMISFLVGATAGAVVGMPLAESIALEGSLESSRMARLPHSNVYGTAAAINVPEIFSAVAKEHTGVSHQFKGERPRDGVQITPFAVLRATNVQKLYLSCGLNISHFAANKQESFYQYWTHSSDEIDIADLPALTSLRFQHSTEQCLRLLLSVFDEHRAGKLNDKFESGTLLYYEDAGWRGMYFRDERRQAYLRYEPSFIEVYPFRTTFSYKPAAEK